MIINKLRLQFLILESIQHRFVSVPHPTLLSFTHLAFCIKLSLSWLIDPSNECIRAKDALLQMHYIMSSFIIFFWSLLIFLSFFIYPFFNFLSIFSESLLYCSLQKLSVFTFFITSFCPLFFFNVIKFCFFFFFLLSEIFLSNFLPFHSS